MARFIVAFQMKPDAPAAEIERLREAERARSAQLHEQGILLELYAVKDAPKAFLLFQIETREQLQQLLEQYPFYPYATWDIHPLVK
ncbi:MAG TPA: muconolactone Delta-isomerase family protein [Ktedonobacteraceae bacterium]|jgi:muconolactone delta-isomerase|nr:muconolactone Delta-isomerase family protein [Ktedonobacteraceae bacterium]